MQVCKKMFGIIDIIFYPVLNNKASIKEHEEHLVNAYQLGKTLENFI